MGKTGLFEKFGLNPLVVRGIRSQGYNLPTPIQRKAIPRALSGQDMIAMARTGSGKTLAFLAPIIHRLEQHSGTVGVRAVVLSPTRELAQQTLKFAIKAAKFTDLRFAALVGGDGLSTEFDKLASNPDVLIATPNRLMHLMTELKFTLKSVEVAVLDEADRLLEKGFHEVVTHILKAMSSENRQTLCFSATLPDSLSSFIKTGLRNPILIQLDQEHILPETLELEFFVVRAEDKEAALLYLLKTLVRPGRLTLVFVSTKYHVEYLANLLKTAEVDCMGLFGDMDQEMREKTVDIFRKGIRTVLIVTDLAARGIDIPLADYVIHFDFPATVKLFIHRSGRVARAGRRGTSYSMISPQELPYLIDLELQLDRNFTYGYMGDDLLRTVHEDLRQVQFDEDEKARLEKSMRNGEKKYKKMRQPASKASVKRAKEITVGLHPRFASEAKAGFSEITDAIKNFRPSLNILEHAAKNKLGSQAVLQMREDRAKLKLKAPKQHEDQGNDLTLPSKRRAESLPEDGQPGKRRGQKIQHKAQGCITDESTGFFDNDKGKAYAVIKQLTLNMPADDETGFKKGKRRIW